MSFKNLDVLLNPQRIAVIGASEDDRAVGYHIFRNMVAKEIEIKTLFMDILNYNSKMIHFGYKYQFKWTSGS